MTRLPSRRRRWLFPVTLALVVVASVWARMHVPRPNLLGPPARVYSSFSQAADGMRDRWTMRLRLDPAAKPPGPRWTLHDGKQPGDGYELRWLPEKLGLQVWRAPDEFLLGAVRLPRMPETIDFQRRGPWFTVLADHAVMLSCLDPLGSSSPPAQAWGFDSAGAGSMGAAEITLIGDATSGSAAERRDLAAVERLRAVLTAEVEKLPPEALEQALGEASLALTDLPLGSPLYDRLRHWLALAQIQIDIGRADLASAARARDAVEQLALLREMAPAPETAGMLMSTLPRLARHSCFRPAVPTAPAEVLANRALWLEVLGSTAVTALAACSGMVDDDLQYRLRLLAHAAGCVQPRAGRPARDERAPDSWHGEPQPAPAEAPPWVGSRWRAFAGGDPGLGDYPDMPGSSRDPVAVAIRTVAQATVLEPVSAVAMRHRLERLLAIKEIAAALLEPDAKGAREVLARAALEAQAIRESSPPREAALAQGLLALRGVGPLEAAFTALTGPFAGGPPLAQRDPLAYALASLLARRHDELRQLAPPALSAPQSFAGEIDSAVEGGIGRLPLKPPLEMPELARFEALLAGDRDAIALAWLQDPSVLPPAQALATALAMAEVVSRPGRKEAAAAPQWDLLDEVRCYTLPLELLAPPAPPRPEHAGGDGGPAAVP